MIVTVVAVASVTPAFDAPAALIVSARVPAAALTVVAAVVAALRFNVVMPLPNNVFAAPELVMVTVFSVLPAVAVVAAVSVIAMVPNAVAVLTIETLAADAKITDWAPAPVLPASTTFNAVTPVPKVVLVMRVVVVPAPVRFRLTTSNPPMVNEPGIVSAVAWSVMRFSVSVPVEPAAILSNAFRVAPVPKIALNVSLPVVLVEPSKLFNVPETSTPVVSVR